MGVFGWAATAARNAVVEPLIQAMDGASARSFPASLREFMAALRRSSDDQGGALLTSGTGNAYAVSTASGISEFRAGLRIVVRADRTSTGLASLSVDGIGPKPWRDADGAQLDKAQVVLGRYYTVYACPDDGSWRTEVAPTSIQGVAGLSEALANIPIWVPATVAIPTLNLLIASVSAAGGGTIGVRAGQGNIDQSVVMQSNVTLFFERGARFTNTGLPSASPGFVFAGSASAGVAIAANLSSGDTSVGTVAAHGLAVGDIVQMFGQRNSVAATAPPGETAASIASRDAWRLGNGTPNSKYCYFGEFGTVKSLDSANPTTAFKLTSGLVFPDYRVDASAEASGTTLRTAAVVCKITPVQNARVIGGRFDLTAQNGQFFKGTYAYRCAIEDAVVDQKAFTGSFGLWRQSFECEFRRCTALQDLSFNLAINGSDTPRYNHFKVTSGHSCHMVDCRSVGGTQCFDFSYFDGETCNLFCRVERFRSFYARANAGTSHPGGYGIDVIDGIFLHCLSNGLAMRSRASRIAGNRIIGDNRGRAGSYGLALGEAWARGNLVQGNHVEGFESLYYLYDGGEADERWGRIDCQFINNHGRNGYYGFNRFSSALNVNTLPSGLVLRGFNFELIVKSYINIGKYTPAVTVESGHYHGPLTDPGTKVAVFMTGEGGDHTIAHNHFYDGGAAETAVLIAGITTATYPDTDPPVKIYPLGDAANLNTIEPNYFHNWAGPRFGSPLSRIRPVRPTAVAGKVRIAASSGEVSVSVGSTVKETLATFTLPAGWMGPSGELHVPFRAFGTGSANAKTLYLESVTTGDTLGQIALASGIASLSTSFSLWANGATDYQGAPPLGLGGAYSSTGATNVYAALDMTVDQSFRITALKAVGTEVLRLRQWSAEVSNPVN